MYYKQTNVIDSFVIRFLKKAKLADKPGSVVDSHSSRHTVTHVLKQPTRRLSEQRHSLSIWSCSRWRLPRFTVT